MGNRIRLTLKQALEIRDNNYRLSDRSRLPIDTYDGIKFSREELDQHIYKLQSNLDAKRLKEQEREMVKFERDCRKQLKAFRTLLNTSGDTKELRKLIQDAIENACRYYI